MTVAFQALKPPLSMISAFTACAAIVIAVMSGADAEAAAAARRPGDLSVGVRQGIYHMPEVNNFKATYERAIYEVGGSESMGIFPFLRIAVDNYTDMELEYGREFGIGPTVHTVALSAVRGIKYEKNGFFPYARAGAILSKVKWKEVPGSFNTGLGWLIGGGAVRKVGRVIVSTDVLYRDLKSQYLRAPGSQKPPSEIDLSGLGLRVGVEIRL